MNRIANPWRSVFRAAWVLYTLALLTATHWPGLTPPGQEVFRTDLVIHVGVLCAWTCLFFGAAFVGVGRPLGPRLALIFLCALCYAGFDELTQPMFGRSADWLDFAADACGALLACGVIWAAMRQLKR